MPAPLVFGPPDAWLVETAGAPGGWKYGIRQHPSKHSSRGWSWAGCSPKWYLDLSAFTGMTREEAIAACNDSNARRLAREETPDARPVDP